MLSIKKIYQYVCTGLFLVIILLVVVLKVNISFNILVGIYFAIVIAMIIYINLLRNIKCPNCGSKNIMFRQKENKLICKICKHEIEVEKVNVGSDS